MPEEQKNGASIIIKGVPSRSIELPNLSEKEFVTRQSTQNPYRNRTGMGLKKSNFMISFLQMILFIQVVDFVFPMRIRQPMLVVAL